MLDTVTDNVKLFCLFTWNCLKLNGHCISRIHWVTTSSAQFSSAHFWPVLFNFTWPHRFVQPGTHHESTVLTEVELLQCSLLACVQNPCQHGTQWMHDIIFWSSVHKSIDWLIKLCKHIRCNYGFIWLLYSRLFWPCKLSHWQMRETLNVNSFRCLHMWCSSVWSNQHVFVMSCELSEDDLLP